MQLLSLEIDKKDLSAHIKNEENRFVLTGYYTTKNIFECKLQQSSVSENAHPVHYFH